MGIVSMQPDNEPSKEPPKEPLKRREHIELYSLIPNLMTLTAMAAGLTAIEHAIDGQWDRAIIAIVIAMVLDGLDGMMARLLKATSDFGANLDTLSDFLAFGIAPSVILYMWVFDESGRIGWMAMIFYTSAIALRLARFNVESRTLPHWQKGFFSGVPSPAGAGLALLPLVFWFHEPDFFRQFAAASPLVGLWTMVVAMLMVSRIPTFSIKTVRVPRRMRMPLLAAAALFLAALGTVPWSALTFVGLAYLASIPVSVMRFRALKKANSDMVEDDDGIDA